MIENILKNDNLTMVIGIVVAVKFLLPQVKEILKPKLGEEDRQAFKEIAKSVNKLAESVMQKMQVTEKRIEQINMKSDNIYKISSDLKDMHDVKRPDGRPMWWVNPEIEENQKKILNRSDKIMETQVAMASLLDKIADKLSEKK